MMLSTLSAAKSALETGSGASASDAELQRMLEGITPVFEGFLNRKIFVDSFTEYRDVYPGQSQFILRNFPVRSVSSVTFDELSMFTSVPDLVLGSDYVFDADGIRCGSKLSLENTYRRGLRVVYAGGLVYGADYGALKVSNVTGVPSGTFTAAYGAGTVASFSGTTLRYASATGSVARGQTIAGSGWTATVDSFIEESVRYNYPGLEEAALMQLRFRWQRRMTLGKSSTVMGNGNTSFETDYKIHPGVAEYLNHLRRTAIDA